MEASLRSELERYALAMAQHEAVSELALMSPEEREGKNVGEPGHREFCQKFMPVLEDMLGSLDFCRKHRIAYRQSPHDR